MLRFYQTGFRGVLSVSTRMIRYFAVLFFLWIMVFPALAQPFNFTASPLNGETVNNPTSLQFGPDNRLYVTQQDGIIYAYNVLRFAAGDYRVSAVETINTIHNVPNYNDNGVYNPSVIGRQVTGLYVTGTMANPVLYVSHSDPRIGLNFDTNLDTNSGTVSRLTWNGTTWVKEDLVRGLPRNEHNHASNGVYVDEAAGILYLAQGGHTNMGAPSDNFAYQPEYALSAAILDIDLNAIIATGLKTDALGQDYYYNLPTLDDPGRPGVNDANDPFGGNNGLNQARLINGGPVQVFSPGWRNPYDIVRMQNGRLYSIDNSHNPGWGGLPNNEGPAGNCTNDPNDLGGPSDDNLHLVFDGYYAGHASPVRGNGALTFGGQSAVDAALINPLECDHFEPGSDGAIALFPASTNGLVEYTAAGFFGGQLQGDLLAASFDGSIYRVRFNAAGTALVDLDPGQAGDNYVPLFSGFGSVPLDVTAQGDGDIFGGTIWAATYGNDNIYVFEPNGFVSCTGLDDILLDDDADGYSNADEIDNGTDPCNNGSTPPDADSDNLSDLNDNDDDNDGINDILDLFPLDANDGLLTTIPLNYGWSAGEPGFGISSMGFTGPMMNLTDDYLNLLDNSNTTPGGATGKFSINAVRPGTALGGANTQLDAFQFGFNGGNNPYRVHSHLERAYFDNNPTGNQSQGIYIGTGDQDNYLKFAIHANGGNPGLQTVIEIGGVPTEVIIPIPGLLANSVELYLLIDPTTGQVQPQYTTDGGTTIQNFGAPIVVPTSWFGPNATAVGIVANRDNADPAFVATWDFMEITAVPVTEEALIVVDITDNIDSGTTENAAFTITNRSTGGQTIQSVIIDLRTGLFDDIVFDPNGTAGDTGAKNFTVDANGTSGTISHNFLTPLNSGFEQMQINFTDFRPLETMSFSLDIDPTSILGDPAPGPNNAGEISGMELSGSAVTVNFSGGAQHSNTLFRLPGSNSDSDATITGNLPATPVIDVQGVINQRETVTSANQVVRVTGPVGSIVRLLQVEAGLYEPAGGGFDIDPFEANKANAVTERTGTIGLDGFIDIDVTLTRTDAISDLNYFIAALEYRDESGNILRGPTSEVHVLEYDPAAIVGSLYRVNAGGPQVAAPDASAPDWSVDQDGNESPYRVTVDRQGTNTNTIDISAMGPGVPASLFNSQRWDVPGGTEMRWEFPVAPGLYEVRLYFAENFSGAQSVGQRIFDVELEGITVLDDYDIFASAGGYTATMENFYINNIDGTIDIEFLHVLENPSVNAIEIVQSTVIPNIPPVANDDYGYFVVDESAVLYIADNDTDANDNAEIDINSVDLDPSQAGTQTTVVVPGGTFDYYPGTAAELNFTPNPGFTGVASIQYTINDLSGAVSNRADVVISITDNLVYACPSIYRVNTGGSQIAAIDGGIPWAADTDVTPSIYLSGDNSLVASGGDPITLSASASAVIVPPTVFNSERYLNPFVTSNQMFWTFPVPSNIDYHVNLYFSENFHQANGQRVFNIDVEGTQIFGNVDIYQRTGERYQGMMLTHLQNITDGSLEVRLHRGGADVPKISAIEIIPDTCIVPPGTPGAGGDPENAQVIGSANNNPDIDVFDPALSKLGLLLPGQLGITGERLEWQITARNRGAIAGTNVVVTDTLRSELQIDDARTSKGTVTIVGQTVTFNIGTLAPGEVVQMVIVTTVLQGETDINNIACLNADNTDETCTLATSPVGLLPATGESPWSVVRVLLAVIAAMSVLSLTGRQRRRKRKLSI